jgi:hypothetical protein
MATIPMTAVSATVLDMMAPARVVVAEAFSATNRQEDW